MGFSLRLILISAALGLAQTAGAQDDTAYVVVYIEVAPSATDRAADLLTDYAEASRGMDGNLLFQALQN